MVSGHNRQKKDGGHKGKAAQRRQRDFEQHRDIAGRDWKRKVGERG